MPAPRGLDGIHVPDDVGNGDVRGRQLFDESQLARQPGDRRLLAPFGNQLAAVLGDRLERIVVDLAAGENGNLLIEQRDELPQDAALGLTAQAEKNEIVARQNGVDELRNDGFLVAHDAGKQRRAVLEQTDEVLAHFVFDGALATSGTAPLGFFQLTKSRCLCHGSTLIPSTRALQPLRDSSYACQQRPKQVVVRPPVGAPPL